MSILRVFHNSTDILSNRTGYQYNIDETVSITTKAYKAILQNQEYIQDVTQQVCNNTTTPNASIKIAGNASNYNTYAEQHSDRIGTYGVEAEAQSSSSYRNYVPEAVLKDRRSCDSNGENCTQTYLVRKLADGKCWMASNLELDLEAGYELTTTFSDVVANVTPVTSASNGTTNLSKTASGTWPRGDYIARSWSPRLNPTYSSKQFLKNSSGSFSPSATGVYTERWGNLYNFCAATALSCTIMDTNVEMPNSICPRGFKLPNGLSTYDAGSFTYIAQLYGIRDVGKGNVPASNWTLYLYPMSYPPAGWQNGSSVASIGAIAYYWARHAASVTHGAHVVAPWNGNLELPSCTNRYAGASVRCVSV